MREVIEVGRSEKAGRVYKVRRVGELYEQWNWRRGICEPQEVEAGEEREVVVWIVGMVAN